MTWPELLILTGAAIMAVTMWLDHGDAKRAKRERDALDSWAKARREEP